jgi:hypothetical protein
MFSPVSVLGASRKFFEMKATVKMGVLAVFTIRRSTWRAEGRAKGIFEKLPDCLVVKSGHTGLKYF